MKRFLPITRRFGPLLVAVIAGPVFVLTVEDGTPGGPILALAILAFVGGAAEVAWSGHPWRNGVVGSLISLLVVAPLAIAVDQLLGSTELAPGETLGSYWLELPFWLALVSPLVFAVTLLGSAIAYFGLHWKPRAQA